MYTFKYMHFVLIESADDSCWPLLSDLYINHNIFLKTMLYLLSDIIMCFLFIFITNMFSNYINTILYVNNNIGILVC